MFLYTYQFQIQNISFLLIANLASILRLHLNSIQFSYCIIFPALYTYQLPVYSFQEFFSQLQSKYVITVIVVVCFFRNTCSLCVHSIQMFTKLMIFFDCFTIFVEKKYFYSIVNLHPSSFLSLLDSIFIFPITAAFFFSINHLIFDPYISRTNKLFTTSY